MSDYKRCFESGSSDVNGIARFSDSKFPNYNFSLRNLTLFVNKLILPLNLQSSVFQPESLNLQISSFMILFLVIFNVDFNNFKQNAENVKLGTEFIEKAQRQI